LVRIPRLSSQEQAAFREGVVSALPLVVGVGAWGIVVGVAMISAGFSPVQALTMGVLVYGGSAQLAVLPLFIAKAPLWVMFVTTMVVNLRYLIYSAVLAPHFSRLSRQWRLLLSYITVDGMFAIFAGRFRPGDEAPHRHWFYLGGSLVVWVVWQVASVIGVFGGALIPRSWSLEFAATLALIALLMPLLFDRAVVCGAIVAAAVSLAAIRLPMNLGLILAVLAGVLVGLAVTRFVSPTLAQGSRVS
jgi:predicted branched-subunit amino acid permease